MVLMAVFDWYQFFFVMFALIACVFGLAVLFTSNVVRMAFYLVISLGATSGLFFLAGAEFVGAMQLMIYVGGTLVLLIFGVMLTAQDAFVSMKTRGGEWILGLGVGGALLALLLHVAFQVESWKTPRENLDNVTVAESKQETPVGLAVMGARVDKGDEEDESLRSGMSGYLLPFEIVSVHLLVVLIAAGYLARAKRRALGVDREQSPAPGPRTRSFDVVGHSALVVIASLAVAAVLVFVPEYVANLAEPLFGSISVFGLRVIAGLFALTAILLLTVLAWQKWAVYGLVLIVLVQSILLVQFGSNLLGGVLFFAVAIAPIAILIVLLCRGGEQSMWSKME